MLTGEDLGGCHHTRLIAVVHAQQHREECYEGLPTPYIPLDEAIHLTAADDIGLDLADDTLLSTRQVKGQTPIEPTYGIADTWQEKPRRSGLAVTLHTEETELDEEEFVELQASACCFQSLLRHGEVDLLDGLGVGHEARSLDDLGGERLGDVGDAGLLQHVEELAHLTAIQPSAGELLGEGIDGHEATADLCGLRLLVDLGVADAVGAVEEDGLTEDEIPLPRDIALTDVGHGAEPYQLDRACAIGEVRDETLLTSLAHLLEVADIALQLHVGHLASELTDLVDARAVDVLRGEVMQEVEVGI